MKFHIKFLLGAVFISFGATVFAGAEITPGGYLLEDAYADYQAGIDPGTSGCFYIIEKPSGDLGAFGALLDFDGPFTYPLTCSRQLKGKVKHREGQAPVVKINADSSKQINCVGEDLGEQFMISFTFKISGKGDKAKLRNGQISSSNGANILFPKKIALDAVNCPGEP